MVRLVDQLELTSEAQLLLEAFRGYPDAHGRELVAASGYWIPDQDVAIQAVHRPSVR